MTLYPLPRSTPELQGVSSKAVLAFVQAVESQITEMHSFMLLRHGQVLAEAWWKPYSPDYPHMLFSLSKSFTSTAVGPAVAEGRLNVEDAVLSFFPEDAPKRVSPNLAAMKVKHLLSMSTGHAADTLERVYKRGGSRWARNFLALPVENEPGAPFVYNNGASFMLSAIVQKLTGQTLLEYLTPRLFEPLGIEHPTWEKVPGGINGGGWGLSITTEDIAKFGQLYLQQGVWNGKQLLPAAWVADATRKQVSNSGNTEPDWQQGYGYQFWRCRHNAYRGDGAFGQFCVVMPEHDAVLAITSGVEKMQPILNLVWQHLLPAFNPAALAPDVAIGKKLEKFSSGLAFKPPQGEKTSPLAAGVSGKVFQVEPNPVKVSELAFTFGAQGCRVAMLQGKRHRHQFEAGYGEWQEGWTTLTTREPAHIYASGVWQNENTFVMTLRFVETPFTSTVTCQFDGGQLTVTQLANLAFGPKEGATLRGKTSG